MSGDSQMDSQKSQAIDPELSEIIAAWPRLSVPLRAGVMAIVRSAG
jgi:hypothetical protein